ncbi:MAG: DNA-binding response regulator [Candidatus Roseilinea sp.]|nr:MAG: DNA-binding response regulator [Candidatus Roseilinea sp.]
MTSRRILIVEDEVSISSALQTLLEHSGYETIAAYSGAEAVERLNAAQPDLVLLDIMLPGMDGFGVCHHIRRQDRYVPIIMLTARDQLSDKLVGMELGADLYLTKPFEPTELIAHIRALFRLVDSQNRANDGRFASRPLTHGPIQMWDAEHRVEVNSKPVELAPKEYELLKLFLQQPGQVFGRETLLRLVWGYDTGTDSRTVDTHVQRLRLKIEPDPSNPQFLITIRGFGYRLTQPKDRQP